MKTKFKQMVSFLLIFTLIFSFMNINTIYEVEAASVRKVTTTAGVYFIGKTNQLYKWSKKSGIGEVKVGDNLVTAKKHTTYQKVGKKKKEQTVSSVVKFKVPKTGYYRITYSDLKADKNKKGDGKDACLSVGFILYNYNPIILDSKEKNQTINNISRHGKNYFRFCSSKAYIEKHIQDVNEGWKGNNVYKTRKTVKVYLMKNTTVLLAQNCTHKGNTFSYRIKIKAPSSSAKKPKEQTDKDNDKKNDKNNVKQDEKQQVDDYNNISDNKDNPITTEEPTTTEQPTTEKPDPEPDNTLTKGDIVTDTGKFGKFKVTKAGNTVEVALISINNKNRTSISIPKTVTLTNGTEAKIKSIGKNVFKNNKKLKKVVISNYITSIGANAFLNCTNLTTVVIRGNSITSINLGAFKNCKKLKSITIGKKVKTIGSNAFYGCKRLKTINLNTGRLNKVGKDAFAGTPTKIKVKLSSSLNNKKATKYMQLLKDAGISEKANFITEW